MHMLFVALLAFFFLKLGLFFSCNERNLFNFFIFEVEMRTLSYLYTMRGSGRDLLGETETCLPVLMDTFLRALEEEEEEERDGGLERKERRSRRVI